MPSASFKSILTTFCLLLLVQARNLSQNKHQTPLEYIVIALVGLALLLIALVVYKYCQKDEKTVEFAVFNSQYVVDKDAGRSQSAHDFPNFDVDLMKQRDKEHEEDAQTEPKSSERRRRRRKVNKLHRQEQRDGEKNIDLTPNLEHEAHPEQTEQ